MLPLLNPYSIDDLLNAHAVMTRELEMVMNFLKHNQKISSSDVQKMLDFSPATATRLLSRLKDEGKLIRIRDGRSWAYVAKE